MIQILPYDKKGMICQDKRRGKWEWKKGSREKKDRKGMILCTSYKEIETEEKKGTEKLHKDEIEWFISICDLIGSVYIIRIIIVSYATSI